MIWNIIEYTATLIECLISADFISRFLNYKNKKYGLAGFASIVIFDFFITNLLNQYVLFEGALGFVRIIGNVIIALIFMKSSVFEKSSLHIIRYNVAYNKLSLIKYTIWYIWFYCTGIDRNEWTNKNYKFICNKICIFYVHKNYYSHKKERSIYAEFNGMDSIGYNIPHYSFCGNENL